MTKPARCTRPLRHSRRQSRRRLRGEALFEALVALVISGALLLGLGYTASRVLNAQRSTTTQTLALGQMRGQLATQADLALLCDGAAPVTIAGTGEDATATTLSVTADCSFANPTVSVPSVAGLSATLAAPVLDAMTLVTAGDEAAALLGGDGALEIAQ